MSRVLTPQECKMILMKAHGYDGRDTGPVAVTSWHEAAVEAHWTDLAAALAAVTKFYSQPAKLGDRLWIMPGHVTEYIRKEGRHPEKFNRLALEGPAPAANEDRARAVQQFAEAMARKKAVPPSYGKAS